MNATAIDSTISHLLVSFTLIAVFGLSFCLSTIRRHLDIDKVRFNKNEELIRKYSIPPKELLTKAGEAKFKYASIFFYSSLVGYSTIVIYHLLYASIILQDTSFGLWLETMLGWFSAAVFFSFIYCISTITYYINVSMLDELCNSSFLFGNRIPPKRFLTRSGKKRYNAATVFLIASMSGFSILIFLCNVG